MNNYNACKHPEVEVFDSPIILNLNKMNDGDEYDLKFDNYPNLEIPRVVHLVKKGNTIVLEVLNIIYDVIEITPEKVNVLVIELKIPEEVRNINEIKYYRHKIYKFNSFPESESYVIAEPIFRFLEAIKFYDTSSEEPYRFIAVKYSVNLQDLNDVNNIDKILTSERLLFIHEHNGSNFYIFSEFGFSDFNSNIKVLSKLAENSNKELFKCSERTITYKFRIADRISLYVNYNYTSIAVPPVYIYIVDEESKGFTYFVKRDDYNRFEKLIDEKIVIDMKRFYGEIIEHFSKEKIEIQDFCHLAAKKFMGYVTPEILYLILREIRLSLYPMILKDLDQVDEIEINIVNDNRFKPRYFKLEDNILKIVLKNLNKPCKVLIKGKDKVKLFSDLLKQDEIPLNLYQVAVWKNLSICNWCRKI